MWVIIYRGNKQYAIGRHQFRAPPGSFCVKRLSTSVLVCLWLRVCMMHVSSVVNAWCLLSSLRVTLKMMPYCFIYLFIYFLRKQEKKKVCWFTFIGCKLSFRQARPCCLFFWATVQAYACILAGLPVSVFACVFSAPGWRNPHLPVSFSQLVGFVFRCIGAKGGLSCAFQINLLSMCFLYIYIFFPWPSVCFSFS